MNARSSQSKTAATKVKNAQPHRPRVLLLGAGNRAHVREAANQLQPALQQLVDVVLVDLDGREELARAHAELAIVLGGDGSILRAANQMGHHQLPVLGVNLGKLGFLADLSPDELLDVLPDVCAGRCRVVEHLMFQCDVIRNGKSVAGQLGLNETAILSGPPYSILDVDLYVDSELVTTYSCDGLIISTPVGSTAHSLSAGGPILRKNLQAFVICPLSPHTLTVRPVVDSADRQYEMLVRHPHESTAVVVDGRQLHALWPNDRVSIRRADPKFKLIEVPGHSDYRTLRQKLGWGGNIPRSV
jgi:NAD+ kinase